MKKYVFIAFMLISGNSMAWFPYGPPMPYYGGYYPYMYNAMGYGWGIQYPSFNYQTIVQNPPPIIINNVPPSQPIYQNGCDHECERMRNYFRKR